MTAAAAAVVATSIVTGNAIPAIAQDQPSKPHSDRLARKYRFEDPDMDLFWVAALAWGPAGGLDAGQAYYIASEITDGDPDSWVKAFSAYGDYMSDQAEIWHKRGWMRNAGEMRLKAFASYRSAWQFASLGEQFDSNYEKHAVAFKAAMKELTLPATFFATPYNGKSLPGVFYQNKNENAPVVLVLGGADTCFEEMFFTAGRSIWDRGYSVAIVDMPGQGRTALEGLHFEAQTEKPIGAVVDILVKRFHAKPGRIALLGCSLGGYFACRASVYEKRLGAVIADAPIGDTKKGKAALIASEKARGNVPPKPAAMRNDAVHNLKMGVASTMEMLNKYDDFHADAALVTVPFLSIVGEGEFSIAQETALDWHNAIKSKRNDLVRLSAMTGADGHVQIANRLRLAQETAGFLDEVFKS